MRWVQLCSSLSMLWYCLSLGLEWKLTFIGPVATAEFSKFAGILSAALEQHHVLGFEVTQLLALFIVVLSKAHLTSHSRMSGSRWVIPPLWLSMSLRPILHSSSVYSFHLLLMNIWVHVSFLITVFSGYIPRSEIAGSYSSCVFSF